MEVIKKRTSCDGPSSHGTRLGPPSLSALASRAPCLATGPAPASRRLWWRRGGGTIMPRRSAFTLYTVYLQD